MRYYVRCGYHILDVPRGCAPYMTIKKIKLLFFSYLDVNLHDLLKYNVNFSLLKNKTITTNCHVGLTYACYKLLRLLRIIKFNSKCCIFPHLFTFIVTANLASS